MEYGIQLTDEREKKGYTLVNTTHLQPTKLEKNNQVNLFIIVTSSGETQLMKEQKEQTLIRCRSFYPGSDQSLVFLSHINICIRYFSSFLHKLKTIFEYKHVEKADLGKHCLLLMSRVFPDDVTIEKYILLFLIQYNLLIGP